MLSANHWRLAVSALAATLLSSAAASAQPLAMNDTGFPLFPGSIFQQTHRGQDQRDERDCGRHEDPDLVSRRLREGTAAQATLRRDPRDEVCVHVGQPEHESRADQDRDSVLRIGSILLQEHQDGEVCDGAVDRTSREMLLVDPFTVAHLGRP